MDLSRNDPGLKRERSDDSVEFLACTDWPSRANRPRLSRFFTRIWRYARTVNVLRVPRNKNARYQ